MFAKTLTVLAVLSGTALPIAVLSVQAVMEAQIPHCKVDLPAFEPIYTDAVTGLKFDPQSRHSGMLSSNS